MTVLDANNSLFEWFQSHDSFEMGRDLKKIIPILDDEAETIISYRLALDELENNGLIAHQDYNEKKVYVLTKSFESYNQNPDLPSWAAKMIANEINEFCEIINDKTDMCCMSSINQKDISNLVHISQYYKSKLVEKEELINALSCVDTGGLNGEGEEDEGDEKKDKKKK